MEKKIKVIFLLHDSVLNGGATRSMLDVIIKLKIMNLIEPIIIYPDKDESMLELLNKYKIKYYHVKYSTWFYSQNMKFVNKIIFILKSLIKHVISYINYFKIKKIIKENNVDVIYTNTMTVYIGCYINKKMKIPHVWHIREFGEEDHGITHIFGKQKFCELLNNYCDKLIFISNALKNKYSDQIKDRSKINVIYDDISTDFDNPKVTFNLEMKNQLNIAMIGSISEGKGQLETLKAIKILKNENIKLYIAGEIRKDKYNVKLKKYIIDNELENKVVFTGYIQDINNFRKKMDIGIVASKSEAFGRTTIEGMLSQMLIIASKAGSNIELIKDGINGFLYELNNEQELANIILNMYNNREEMRKISINGYEYANNFTLGIAADKIYKIVKELSDNENLK